MILYLDTSALVKLYIEEAGSSAVATPVDGAAAVATARITYAEARAAFAAASPNRWFSNVEPTRSVESTVTVPSRSAIA